MSDSHCLNCEQKLTTAENFCSNCGQSVHTHRFNLKHFFHEGFHAFTHADKGLFYLLKELALRPGTVAREYIAGKRKKYYNPFTFFLILAAFFVLSNSLSRGQANENKFIPDKITKIKDITKRSKAIDAYHRRIKVNTFMTKNGNIMAMIAVPFFALCFWLSYFKRQFNYSEHLIANLMFVSFANLAFSIIVYPLQNLLRGTPVASFLFLIGFLLQIIYFSYAYKGLMLSKGFWPNVKVVVISILALVLWISLTSYAMAIYINQ